MFVCICKGITDSQIKEAVYNGASNIREVRNQLGAATECCKCLPDLRTIVDDTLEQVALSHSTPNYAQELFYAAKWLSVITMIIINNSQ